MKKQNDVRMEKRDLPVKLSDELLADRGRELAELRREIDEAEESRKLENNRRKGIIADMEEAAADLLRTLGSGTELHPVECVISMDFKRRLVVTTRDDTGEEVSSRSMSAEELEGRLEEIENQMPPPAPDLKVIDIPAIVQTTRPVSDSPLLLPPAGEDVSREFAALVDRAVDVIRQTQRASVTTIQRRLRVGYTAACAIMDELEVRKVVGPPNGAAPREILNLPPSLAPANT